MPPEEQSDHPEPANLRHGADDAIRCKHDEWHCHPECPAMIPAILRDPEAAHPQPEDPGKQHVPELPAPVEKIPCPAL